MSEVAYPPTSVAYPPIPPAGWLTGPAAALLGIASAALDGATDGAGETIGQHFPRRAITHGVPKPVPGKGANGQLYVALAFLHAGRAGEEQFKFPDGKPGTIGQRATSWTVQLWAPFVMPYTGVGASAVAASTGNMGSAENLLLGALGAVWAALQAVALGASGPWLPAGLDPSRKAQQMLVGRANPLGPAGALAGYDIPVAVQV